MKVVVYNYQTEASHAFTGSADKVAFELLRVYPWARKVNHARNDVPSIVQRINRAQMLAAQIQDHSEGEPIAKAEPRNLPKESDEVVCAMLGHHHQLDRWLEAAKFLAGRPADPDATRKALYEADGDPEVAALLACGLEPSDANLKALRAVQGLSGVRKAEPEFQKPASVEPGVPDAQQAAEEVRRAFDDGYVLPVKLGGKHSAGSLLARDDRQDRTWLLKPGSGGQSPAAGASQDPSTQARREAAFWHVADAWGLGDNFPRAELLLIDGQEYAALELLPWSFKPLDKLKKDNVGAARAALEPYVRSGQAYRWAVLDYVLGNPDRHAGNLMVRDGDVRLIDHGSAMAGLNFDPAHDRNSFTPYYLRAWYDGKFSQLASADKLKAMPRLSQAAAQELKTWLEELDPTTLDHVLGRYGVHSEPAKERLAALKARVALATADLAVNQAWVET